VVVGIVAFDDEDPDPMKKWFSDTDRRKLGNILEEILGFLSEQGVVSVVMTEKIIGCPHEEGVDYPEGEACPTCPFWKGRDRWTGEMIH